MPTYQEQQHANLEALGENDRKARSTRTGLQAGVGSAILVMFDYVVRGFFKVDLDPFSEATEMPITVAAAITFIIPYLTSVYMNRKKK